MTVLWLKNFSAMHSDQNQSFSDFLESFDSLERSGKMSLCGSRIWSDYNLNRVSLKPNISCCWLVFTLSFFMTQNFKFWISTYGLFKMSNFCGLSAFKIRRLKKLLKLRSYYWQAKPSKWQNWAPRRILISPPRSELASFNPNNTYNSVTNYP